jgi:hypothetical protein
MTPIQNIDKSRRNFEHTVRVVTASIHAAEAFAPRTIAATFVVSRLAAAGAAGLKLPQGEILALGSQLAVRMEAVGSDLQVTLQLRGFQALRAHGGKSGRLVSADQRVHVAFAFDAKGKAVCVMTDSDIARGGLEQFHIEVFGD